MISGTKVSSCYIYPMSNSTNGSAIHSEYNVRSSLLNLLTYSAANDKDHDFLIVDDSGEPIKNLTFDSINKTVSFRITGGTGNINGYFINIPNTNYFTVPFEYDINVNSKLYGDINGDGIIDAADVVALQTYLALNGTTKVTSDNSHCDLNGDGIIDEKDVEILSNSFIGTKLINSKEEFYLYLRLIYNQNIADGLQFQILNAEDVNTETNSIKENFHFNDIGIFIGTIIVESINGEYTFNFERNENITRCISLDKLGDKDGLEDQLSEILTRLKILNIFGGNFYISDETSEFGKALNESGINFRFRINLTTEDIPVLNGDINRDGIVDSTDLEKLRSLALNEGTKVTSDNSHCDLNSDGVIDDKDVEILNNHINNGGALTGPNKHYKRLIGTIDFIKINEDGQIDSDYTQTILKFSTPDFDETYIKHEKLKIKNIEFCKSSDMNILINKLEAVDIKATNIEVDETIKGKSIEAKNELSLGNNIKATFTYNENDKVTLNKEFSANKVYNAVWN